MSRDDKPRPERLDTDSRLRREREETDAHLARQGLLSERHADQVVERARERADDLLEETREAADAENPTATPSGTVRLEQARASEDAALSAERAQADETLERERTIHRRMLVLPLALERDATDDSLLTERTRSDRAVASRDEFLGIVSHDTRTILGALAMSSDLLTRLAPQGEAGEKMRREARRIGRLTGRMDRLVGDLLDVVSMESGKLALVVQPHDPALLLAEVVECFQFTAAEQKLTLAVEPVRDAGQASFDRERVLQVLTNLVGNAMKFTAPGGSVTLALEGRDEEICFTVRDTGCGIAPEQIGGVFERFSQVTPSDRRGLGLGLYIARSIVEAHGGKIWAESAPGRGSAFHFTLLRGQPAA